MRCADHRHQRGAAILIALVAVIIAVAISASLIGSLGRSIDSATGRQNQAQARLLARGAADWARNVLADDIKRTSVDHLREPWTVRVPPTPVNSGPLDGEISGEIVDWSGLFNVNNLAPGGERNETAREEFERLLNVLGISDGQALQLAQELQDWISVKTTDDATSRGASRSSGVLAPRSALADINELRHLPGFSAMLIDRLRPYAVAVPAPSKINVNTAPAEVLSAITPDLSLDAARVLAAERERAWFKDKADFLSRAGQQESSFDQNRIDVVSRYFLVTGRASQGNAMVRMEILLDRLVIWPEIVWQRIL